MAADRRSQSQTEGITTPKSAQSLTQASKVNVEQDTPFQLLQRTSLDVNSLSPAGTQRLQRMIGNQAVGKLLLQRKITPDTAGDKYEQKADAVAKQVVNTSANQYQAEAVDQKDPFFRPVRQHNSPSQLL